jgi:GWxTD domain-containing protein
LSFLGIENNLEVAMRKLYPYAVFLLALLLPVTKALPSSPQKAPKMDKTYEAWLKDEVNYLITDQERKLFLALPTDRERNAFINAFWARRDPVPLTPANEFKEEHYRRLAEAKDKYGLHTDRGRIYILLGRPDSIDNENSGKYIFPCEVWNYFSLDIPSFPGSLRLLFYKQWGVGELRLFSPLFDGLEYLMPQRHYDTRAGDDAVLRKLIRDYVGPDFLMATESVTSGMDRLQSEKIINTLRDTQEFQSLRASAGRPVVTTYVTYEKLPFEVMGFFTDDGRGNAYYDAGLYVSPADLTFEKNEAKYYGRQDVFVTVKDAGKNVVAQFNDRLNIELTEEEFAAKKAYGLSYAFAELLIPGEYTLNVLLRDFVSNRVGEKEVRFSLPAAPRSSPLLLASRAERLPFAQGRAVADSAAGGKTPFVYGNFKLSPRVGAAFGRDENIILYFEVYPRTGDSGQFNIRYDVRDARGEAVLSSRETVSIRPGEKVLPVEKAFSPKALADGAYTLVVGVSDAAAGSDLFEQTARLVVSKAPPPAGAFSYEQPYGPAREEMSTQLGLQSLFRNDLPRARQFFNIALSSAPGYLPAKINLARCHVLEGNDGPALDLLLPLAKEGVENGDVFTILANISYGKKDLGKTAEYLERAAELKVESVEILNFLGSVYLEKGDAAKARETLARSLKIKSDQPLVKTLLESLGK